MLHSLAPFAQLRRLTDLSLHFYGVNFYPLADVVHALVSLTGLARLALDLSQPIGLSQPTLVPTALGQLTGLQLLIFCYLEKCVLEVGCFDLPNLLGLEFDRCDFENADVLASVPALPSLTRIKFENGSEPPLFAQLLLLPQLHHMVFQAHMPCVADYSDAGAPQAASWLGAAAPGAG